MSSSYVWVQLFYQGKDEPEGQPIPIEASEVKYGGIIAGLKEAVKDKMAEELMHCSAAKLLVYAADTERPFSQDKAIDPADNILPGTTSKNPLIVVAPQPQRDAKVDAQMEELLEFVRNEKDDRTKNKEMSKASTDWAESILAAYCVKHDRMKEVVDGLGSFKDPQPYKWTVQTTEGEPWNKGEHGGTPGALVWLKENFLSSSSPYDLKEVTGAQLPRVRGNRKSATGKSDILIGAANHIHKGSTFDFAIGLVELTPDRYPLKLGQNLLQLLSLSTASTFKKAVVLLATDCNTKWEIFYFSDANTITSQVYEHGSKAWDGFLRFRQQA